MLKEIKGNGRKNTNQIDVEISIAVKLMPLAQNYYLFELNQFSV